MMLEVIITTLPQATGRDQLDVSVVVFTFQINYETNTTIVWIMYTVCAKPFQIWVSKNFMLFSTHKSAIIYSKLWCGILRLFCCHFCVVKIVAKECCWTDFSSTRYVFDLRTYFLLQYSCFLQCVLELLIFPMNFALNLARKLCLKCRQNTIFRTHIGDKIKMSAIHTVQWFECILKYILPCLGFTSALY